MAPQDDRSHELIPLLCGEPGPLSFDRFPVSMESIDDTPGWFHSFAGKSEVEVRYLLRNEWEAIEHPSLRAFSDALLACCPCGIVTSRYADSGRNAWVLLSRRLPAEAVVNSVHRGESVEGVFYLAEPYSRALRAGLSQQDLVRTFFLYFGGLRCSPPFRGGRFFDFPSPVSEVCPNEERKWIGTPWEAASSLFEDEVGDQLVLSTVGDIGWLLHNTREIVPQTGGFPRLLFEVVRFGGMRSWKADVFA